MKKTIALLSLLPTLLFSQESNEVLKVSDPTVDNTLQVQDRSYRDCNYLESDVYIINKNNVIYQSCNTRKVLDVDINSFRIPSRNEGGYFALDKDGVYFRGEKIITDTTGFKVVGTSNKELLILWKTKAGVYKNNQKIMVDDIDTFSPVKCFNGYYFKDKYCVYYFDKKLEGSDGASVYESCNEFTYDKNQVYYSGEILTYQNEKVKPINMDLVKTNQHVLKVVVPFYVDEVIKNRLILMPNMDALTLRGLSRHYAIDKNYAYYTDKPLPTAKENLSHVKVWDQVNRAYLSDGKKVYSRDNDLENDFDATSFKMLPHSDFCMDKNGVYERDYIASENKVVYKKFPFKYTVPLTDNNTFITDNSKYIIYENQAYDPWNKKYYADLTKNQIQLARENKLYLTKINHDKKANVEISYNYNLYKVDNKIYWNKTATTADAETFTPITTSLYKDKKNVYIYNRDKGLIIVEGFDRESLSQYRGFLIDKDYIYSYTQKIIESKGIEILAIFSGYRKGCSRDSSPSSNYYLFKNDKGYWLVNTSNTVTIRNITDIINEQDQWAPNLNEKFKLY
ncbi:hypothetical protein HMPREF9713_01519 [Myroides odoratimimus CCUG 12700]|uniref:DKNYY domain-containing protein n=1 Tax=Myroides odoratimimus TaxID=76832 RepID=UPI0003532EA4|nr:DKNYY domain-containing protein [Myroides odoratimimus]EPH11679.1 hypothetical protein HMPREF9713_01519 [Myroides odoratimimus CCUG 12700]